MTRVLHHETKVQITCEVDSQLNMGHPRSIDNVCRVATQLTGFGVVVPRRHASSTFVSGQHNGNWVIHTITRSDRRSMVRQGSLTGDWKRPIER